MLSTAGYSKLGLPGDMVPGVAETTPTATSNGDHTDTSLGLAFHSDSAFLRGMQMSLKTAGIGANVNGAVIPARSENDTSNNPHNPLYGIQKAGADGSILTLCGTQNTRVGRQLDGARDDGRTPRSGRPRSTGRATSRASSTRDSC